MHKSQPEDSSWPAHSSFLNQSIAQFCLQTSISYLICYGFKRSQCLPLQLFHFTEKNELLLGPDTALGFGLSSPKSLVRG